MTDDITQTKRPPRRSEWIDLGRVLATAMIVYYHLPSSNFSSHGPVGDLAWSAFDNPVGPLAFFFLISGYFTKCPITFRRAGKKVFALLIPYLLWNLVCLPGIHDKSLLQALTGWGDSGGLTSTPADYPLWFVRDLIVLTLLSPLLQKAWAPVFVVSATFVFAGNTWNCGVLQILNVPLPSDTLLYTLGLFLSRFNIDTLHAAFRKSLPVLVILLVAFYTLKGAGWLPTALFVSKVVTPLLMTGALLLLSESLLRIVPKAGRSIASMAPACFFVYAAHAPAVILVSYAVTLWDPALLGNPWVLAAVPLFIIGCALVVFCGMKRYSPGLLLPLFAHEGHLRLPRQKTRCE